MSGFMSTGELVRIPIAINGNGDNSVVAAIPGYCIRVIEIYTESASAVTMTPKSDVGGGATSICGPVALSTTKAFNPQPFDGGLMQTAAGKALNLNLSSGVAVNGFLCYQAVLP